MQTASVILFAPSTRPAVLSQVGLEIEELVAGSHRETDPRGVGVADHNPVAEHSVSQVSRRTVEEDEVDSRRHYRPGSRLASAAA
jgi:hypothetical protein